MPSNDAGPTSDDAQGDAMGSDATMIDDGGSPSADGESDAPESDASWRTPQPGPYPTSDSGALSITAVYVSRIGQNIYLEVDGTGFGSAPTTLPAVGYLNQFRLTDSTQGSWCAGGAGCPVYMQFTSWSDTAIVIDGFGTQYGGQYKMLPGDTVSISVQSTAPGSGGAHVTWTGTLQSEPAPPLDPGGPTPEVSNVAVSHIGQNMHIEVDGAGFGHAPTTLPGDGYLNQFRLTDSTQGGWCAGGAGCPVYLQFTSWSDTAIVIDGFGTQYGSQYKVASGDAVAILVQNAQGPEFTVWNGTLQEGTPPPPDPNGPAPRVASVTFSQVGANLNIEVDGSGFGHAPTTLPATGYLNQFRLTDSTQGGWCSGGAGCPVYLQFTSWTDGRIVISGFGTQYGSQYKVASGDAVSILVQNAQGPEFTIWNGTLP
jgi:protein involved in polysaccharide export with SLBB domain